METKSEEITWSEAQKEQGKGNYQRKRHGKHFTGQGFISAFCKQITENSC